MIKSDELKPINPKHYLDIIVWLAKDRNLHQKEGQKALVINMVGNFFMTRDKDKELTEEQKHAIGYMYHADSFLVKVYVRMILTGCTEQEAFNFVGARK